MTKDDLLSTLAEFVSGQRPVTSWLTWWETAEGDVEKLLSRGSFLRLKPLGIHHGPMSITEDSYKEALAVLKKEGRAAELAPEVSEAFGLARKRGAVQRTFGAEVLGVCTDELNASSHPDFAAALLAEYEQLSPPPPVKKWLRERLKNAFQSAGQPPRWITSEPQWVFEGREPLLFLGQVSVPERMDHRLSAQELYVFSRHVPQGDGTFRQEYRLLVQHPDMPDAGGVAEKVPSVS